MGFGLDLDPTDYPNPYRIGINYNIVCKLININYI